MALSYSLQSGDGATTNFVVPVAYLDRTHVKVFISAVETLAFTWVSDTIIQITPAPPVGVLNIEIRRTTPRSASLVDYINGSVLFDTDLDTGQLQSLFIAQEYFEQATSAFPSGHTIQSHSDGVPGDTIAKGTVLVYDENSKLRSIPVVADGALLRTNSTDPKGVAWLTKGTDGYTLEVEDAATGKLTWQQGLRKLLTTAGDLLVATASGVAARLGVGATNTVLVADSSLANKMSWKSTLAGLTLTAPVVSGTVTGTYTLGGTPTIPGALTAGTTLTLSPFAVNSQTTQAHGLGVIPAFTRAELVCLTAELGYAINDRLEMNIDQGNETTGCSATTYKDATNLILTISNNAALQIARKDTKAKAVITAANWKITIVPYKLT